MSGLYPASPRAPGSAASGGNPAGPGTTRRTGEKSTVAGKSTTPSTTRTSCTAAPAFASFCARLMPRASACAPLDESRTRYHTARPPLLPRWSGNVAVPSACSTALLMNNSAEPDPAMAGAASAAKALSAIAATASARIFVARIIDLLLTSEGVSGRAPCPCSPDHRAVVTRPSDAFDRWEHWRVELAVHLP